MLYCNVFHDSGIYSVIISNVFMVLNLDIIFQELYEHVLLFLVLFQTLMTTKKGGGGSKEVLQ